MEKELGSLDKYEESSEVSSSAGKSEMKPAVLDLLAKMFTKANFEADGHLQRSLNGMGAVPIEYLLTAPQFKDIDEQVIRSAIYESKAVSVAEDGVSVRPVHQPEQTTLILRDIPSNTSSDAVVGIFTQTVNCPTPQSVRSEMNDTWFVTFATKNEAQAALQIVTKQTFEGKSVKARLKTERTGAAPTVPFGQPQGPPNYGGRPGAAPREFFSAAADPSMLAYGNAPPMGPGGPMGPPMQPIFFPHQFFPHQFVPQPMPMFGPPFAPPMNKQNLQPMWTQPLPPNMQQIGFVGPPNMMMLPQQMLPQQPPSQHQQPNQGPNRQQQMNRPNNGNVNQQGPGQRNLRPNQRPFNPTQQFPQQQFMGFPPPPMHFAGQVPGMLNVAGLRGDEGDAPPAGVGFEDGFGPQIPPPVDGFQPLDGADIGPGAPLSGVFPNPEAPGSGFDRDFQAAGIDGVAPGVEALPPSVGGPRKGHFPGNGNGPRQQKHKKAVDGNAMGNGDPLRKGPADGERREAGEGWTGERWGEEGAAGERRPRTPVTGPGRSPKAGSGADSATAGGGGRGDRGPRRTDRRGEAGERYPAKLATKAPPAAAAEYNLMADFPTLPSDSGVTPASSKAYGDYLAVVKRTSAADEPAAIVKKPVDAAGGKRTSATEVDKELQQSQPTPEDAESYSREQEGWIQKDLLEEKEDGGRGAALNSVPAVPPVVIGAWPTAVETAPAAVVVEPPEPVLALPAPEAVVAQAPWGGTGASTRRSTPSSGKAASSGNRRSKAAPQDAPIPTSTPSLIFGTFGSSSAAPSPDEGLGASAIEKEKVGGGVASESAPSAAVAVGEDSASSVAASAAVSVSGARKSYADIMKK